MIVSKSYKMSIFSLFRLLQLQKPILISSQYALQTNNYAVMPMGKLGKKGKKFGQSIEKKELPVENDVKKLLKFVCGSNIYQEGQDVEIKPDSEYPDWLWNIRTGPAPPLEELDPNTKAYWRRLRTMGMRKNNKFSKYKKF